jgi:DNA-binding MurR/RpiR family transcriptional regulator
MALGFTGYPELRQALRPLVVGGEPVDIDGVDGLDGVVRAAAQALTGRAVAGQALLDPPGRRASGRNELQLALDNEIRNLGVVRDRLADTSAVTELATALAVSEPLPVLGLRVSAGLATTFAYYARRILPDVRLFVHGGSELTDGLHTARKSGAGWLLAVVLPRYPAEAVRALEQASELGLRTAVITDREDVPFPADVVLAGPVGERLVFDSHAAPLSLVMVLVEAMADAAPLRTQARLEEYERMTDQTGVFLRS